MRAVWDVWVYRWIDACMHVWMYIFMYECMDEWTDGRMSERGRRYEVPIDNWSIWPRHDYLLNL